MNKGRFITLFLLTFLTGILLAGETYAATHGINYQGILEDSAGTPVPDLSYNMAFRIYDAATAGTLLYEESQTVTTVNGIYNVLLGTGTATVGTFDPALFPADRWLEVNVNGETLTPRQQVTSVAFSLHSEEAAHAANAGNADTVDGMHAASLNQSGHVVRTDNPHNVTAAQVGTLSKGEIDSLLTKHTNDASAHHVKTTTFTELTGQIADAQIPASIARDSERTWSNLAGIPAGFADNVDNNSGGDITDVTAGTGLNGGGTTGNATLNVNVPLALNGSQPLGGVLSGTNSNIAGYGVYGSATATGTAVNYGGYFESSGDSGTGVFGTSDNGTGVKGTSINGTAGYFSSSSGNGLIINSGNVGIGTTTPTEKLEVTGNQKINGNLQVTGNISWPAKTGYLSIPPAAFVCSNSARQYTNGGSWLYLNEVLATQFNAPVFLPQGAIVTRVTTDWRDNSSANASFTLVQDHLGVEQAMASGLTNWMDSNPHSVSETTIANPVIDHSTYSYHFSIIFPAGAPVSDMIFYGARIEYTYTGN